MENCLTSVSKNLIEEISKLKIRLPFNIDDKFKHLEKYFYKFEEKYSELDNRNIETFNFKKSFYSNKEYNIPCNTIHILRYIWNDKSLLENIYETCQKLKDNGVVINRPPRDGRMAFIKSPNEISIELLQQGEALEIIEPWKSMENEGTW